MDTLFLKRKANELRRKVVEMCVASGGHIASSFSYIDILVALYYGEILNVDPKTPDAPERDRFILSKGHGETALYAMLSDRGFIPDTWVQEHYRDGDCRLGGHPDHRIPGVEITSGALGHGLGLGIGISLAAHMNGEDHRQFVLLGDAECTEGSVWEAALFAGRRTLSNLTAIIDHNGIGSIDFVDAYSALKPLAQKWSAFGWRTLLCDGHDFCSLLEAFAEATSDADDRPVVIIATTVKGKGVSFLENDPMWHVKSLSLPDEIEQARHELQSEFTRLRDCEASC